MARETALAPHHTIQYGTAMHVATVAALLASLLFVVIALLHVGWAMGSPFPSRDRDRLLAVVIGRPVGTSMPGQLATWFVVIGLLAAAWCTCALVGLLPAPVPVPLLRVFGVLLVGVFALRSVGGYFESRFRPEILGTPYFDYSRRLYSPLAGLMAVSVACAMLA